MRTNALLAALLALPMLMMGCNRHDQSPAAAAAAPGEDRQATAPSSPDKALDNAPPAAGKPSDSSSTPPSSAQTSPSSAAPASPSPDAQPGEARKAY